MKNFIRQNLRLRFKQISLAVLKRITSQDAVMVKNSTIQVLLSTPFWLESDC
jgi:hypothetical protein